MEKDLGVHLSILPTNNYDNIHHQNYNRQNFRNFFHN